MAVSLLATSSLCSSVWAQAAASLTINGIELEAVADPAKDAAWKTGPYFVIADVDDNGVASKNDVLLKVVASVDGKNLTYSGVTLDAADNSLDLEETAWSFLEYPQKDANGKATGFVYSLQSIGTGKELAADDKGAIITEAAKSSLDESKKQYTRFATADNDFESQFTQKGNLFLYTGASVASGLEISDGAITSVKGTASKIILCKLKTKTLTTDEVVALNDVMGGEGFNLDFKADNKYEWKNDSLTNVNLKAFYVAASGIDLGNSMSIPAGVYFATAYPEELNGTDVAITADNVELFYQCTFLAIDPKGNYDINKADRASGIGYELKTVQGSEMNFFGGVSTSDNYSAGDEVYVGNACFEIQVPDPMTAPETYNIFASNMHVFVSADKNAAEKHEAKSGYIGLVTDQNVNYLVTNSTGLKFTTTNSTLMDGDDLATLLQKEDAPSIYTIQFVSGQKKEDETEYKQYLTVKEESAAFALASTVEYDEADPMYQFVVTAIDKDDKTITFTNRQTQKSFEVSLYENEEGVYTVYPATATNVYVEWVDGTTTNENVEFKAVDLANTKIVLTSYTVEDKFATFVNRADGMGLVQFELAKNSDAATAFYVGGTRDDDGELQADEILAYVDADNMTQFELVKSEKPVNVLNNYIYLKDKRILTSTVRDTVAYYTYAVKAFDNEIDNYYLTYTASPTVKYELTQKTASTADKYLIKENLDGSVSLIKAVTNALVATANYAEVADPKDDEDAAWTVGDNYDLSAKISTGLKTFMVEETPAVSLEAVPQHISIAVARGGFMTMDENKDARLAIASEAGEDLTFWVDTVHSDRNIPSFYIAKGGNFLYNSSDSATYYAARKNYRFNMENQKDGEAKLIFKAGELVSSDTLRTTVDSKSVLVAENDNAPKKIKGNLNKFQYQIILDENGSDEYVIRQGNKYVSVFNNYFYMDQDKKKAVRFLIEKQSAPTANEGVAVSEVKVIAGDGQVTIAGAAGKKVVVSNILGQVVANTVISSDNATIAAPAGVVVVAVEGEAAVKAIVK
ncbi:DUF6383 domain-containing protein [uncultured Parabacteroides sp.]|nr:DUF6383 domain-containing protein [uncultured Parabacteroides sp.]